MISVGIQAVVEDHGSGEELRQQDAKKLAEDVAQWKKVQKSYGMEEALVLQVLADLALQRLKIGKDVAVGDDYAAWLGGSA